MRRWRILTLLLALLAAGGLLAAGRFVSASGRSVMYGETLLQGQAEDFSGVVVHTKSRMGGEVLWKTDYRPGGGAKSTARYGASDWEPLDIPPSVRAYSYLTNGPTQRSDGEADLMVQAVASRTPENEVHEEVIRAADWYEYFPLDIALESIATDKLRIPVPEDFFVRVSVSRMIGGGYSFTVSPEDSIAPTLSAVSAGLERDGNACCWFALDAGRLDTSLLPGGGGVMRFDSADGAVTSAYPLPDGTRVCDLWLSEDQSTLYVLHSLDGAHTLTALETESMAVRQEIALPIAADAALSASMRDGAAVLLPASDETLTVLTVDDDSRLTLRTQVSTQGDPVMEKPDVFALRDLLAADWADGRLALARQQYVNADITQDLDLLVSVYDETGSRSSMLCRSSLAREMDPERETRRPGGFQNFSLQPGWTRPVTVEIEP